MTAAQAELQRAERDFNRQKRIREEDPGAISQRRLDLAESTLAAGRSRVSASQAELERARQNRGRDGVDNAGIQAARAALNQAELELQWTRVVAQEGGLVTDLRLEVGTLAQPGKPLMTFVGINDVWIQADMRENNLAHIKPGDPVDIALDVQPGRIVTGRVRSIGFGVDSGTSTALGSLPVIENDRNWLRDAQRFPVIIELNEAGVESAGFADRRTGDGHDLHGEQFFTAAGWQAVYAARQRVLIFILKAGSPQCACIRSQRDLAAQRTLRLAVGIALGLVFANTVNWPGAVRRADPCVGVACARRHRHPHFNRLSNSHWCLALALLLGLLLLPMLHLQPAAGVLLIILALFHCFYFGARGGPAALTTFLLVGITIIPVIGSESIDAAIGLSGGLITGSLAAFLLVWFAHCLFPEPPPEPADGPQALATCGRARPPRWARHIARCALPSSSCPSYSGCCSPARPRASRWC